MPWGSPIPSSCSSFLSWTGSDVNFVSPAAVFASVEGVCMCMCICIFMRARVYACLCVSACAYACVRVFVYVCMCMRGCGCVSVTVGIVVSYIGTQLHTHGWRVCVRAYVTVCGYYGKRMKYSNRKARDYHNSN